MSGLIRVSAKVGGVMMFDDGSAQWLAAEIVRRHEGLRLAPYFCPAGKMTVGYGHVILPEESYLRAGIDEDMAEMLLHRDLAWAMFEARRVGRVLTSYQAAALASLIFNIGAAAWQASKIRRLVMAGDWQGASAEFIRWNKIGGEVSAGLSNRRVQEQRLFEGGLWIG